MRQIVASRFFINNNNYSILINCLTGVQFLPVIKRGKRCNSKQFAFQNDILFSAFESLRPFEQDDY